MSDIQYFTVLRMYVPYPNSSHQNIYLEGSVITPLPFNKFNQVKTGKEQMGRKTYLIYPVQKITKQTECSAGAKQEINSLF